MPLDLATLEALRADEFADDVPIDETKMRTWTEAQATAFFASGGTEEPSAPIEASTADDDLIIDGDDVLPAEADVVPEPAMPAELTTTDAASAVVITGDDIEQPVFQTGGGDTSMVAKEVDKETEQSGLEAPPSSVVTPTAASPPPPSVATKAADGRTSAKAVLVGDSGVGKTALMMRFSQDLFQTNSKATIGVDLHTRDVPLPAGGGNLSLQLWDTAGQEQFASLTSSYFRQAHCVVLAYDVHNPSSFKALAKWMTEVDRHAPAEVVKLVVGTKCDSGSGATAVSEDEAAAFATKHGAICERCSAKDGIHITELFSQVAVRIVRNGFDHTGNRAAAKAAGRASIQVHGGKFKKKGCC